MFNLKVSKLLAQLVAVPIVLSIALGSMVLSFPAQAEAWQDPTRPFGSKTVAKAKAPFKLESILFAKQRRVAVINGEVVAVGDRVEGALVADIQPTRVKLNQAGKLRWLSLAPPASVRQ